MIISEFAICSTNNRNYRRLKSLGYEFNIGDQVKVNVIHLSKSSRSLVFVQCDICGFNKSMKYSMYLKNIKKYGFYTCSGKCSSIKYKKTCLEKFGAETPLQNDEIKGKLKKYFLMKYGVNHPSMINEFEIKKQQTNLEKYGVRQQMQISENLDKVRKTKLERYGDENFNNFEKSFQTKLEKYGDGNFNNKEKYKNTCLLKYGVDHNMKCKELFIKNQISRYRVSYIDGIRYQSSYELDFIQKCQHLNLIIEEGPTISYLFEGIDRKYHSDFYLPNFNLICEIKSEYIYNKEVKINEIKKESSIKSGYNFIFIIDKDYSNFIKIIENNVNSAF